MQGSKAKTETAMVMHRNVMDARSNCLVTPAVVVVCNCVLQPCQSHYFWEPQSEKTRRTFTDASIRHQAEDARVHALSGHAIEKQSLDSFSTMILLQETFHYEADSGTGNERTRRIDRLAYCLNQTESAISHCLRILGCPRALAPPKNIEDSKPGHLQEHDHVRTFPNSASRLVCPDCFPQPVN